ncbi:MAG: hypothetical protein J0H57_18805 [Rhodospirillales bacterium]|nr:hypothetical protein [Rhodospirillales bacterium]
MLGQQGDEARKGIDHVILSIARVVGDRHLAREDARQVALDTQLGRDDEELACYLIGLAGALLLQACNVCCLGALLHRRRFSRRGTSGRRRGHGIQVQLKPLLEERCNH